MDIKGYSQPLSKLLEGYTPSVPFRVRSDHHAYISPSTGRKASHVLSTIWIILGCSHPKRTYTATKPSLGRPLVSEAPMAITSFDADAIVFSAHYPGRKFESLSVASCKLGFAFFGCVP